MKTIACPHCGNKMVNPFFVLRAPGPGDLVLCSQCLQFAEFTGVGDALRSAPADLDAQIRQMPEIKDMLYSMELASLSRAMARKAMLN
jgi:sarcosine oxidase delta subunit